MCQYKVSSMCRTNFSLDSTYFISLMELSFSSKQSNLLCRSFLKIFVIQSCKKEKKNHIEVHLLCNTPFRINFLGGWYFVSKIVLVIEKNFEAEITRTIYLNSESSEQFSVTNAFLTCSWRFLIRISNKLEQLEFDL